ncbi:MAG TPA: hypothetical protein P5038_07100 [Candidatus Paceibacterota bacterium]|nr:hypothetical protein [Candidatus Paceibacterota bacterium]
MKLRLVCLWAALTALAAAAESGGAGTPPAGTRPNILFILVDDP